MKTRVLIIALGALLLLSWQTALGQVTPRFGVKAGLSLSKLAIEPEFITFDTRTAFTGGVFLILDLPSIWGVQIEALYVPKGGTDEAVGTDENGESTGVFTQTFAINYVEFPVLARLSIGTGPLHVLIGPALAFKTSAKIDGNSDPALNDNDNTWEGITGSDVSFIVGGGGSFPTGFGRVEVDARYSIGMTNVYERSASDAELKNSGFLIMTGVTF